MFWKSEREGGLERGRVDGLRVYRHNRIRIRTGPPVRVVQQLATDQVQFASLRLKITPFHLFSAVFFLFSS